MLEQPEQAWLLVRRSRMSGLRSKRESTSHSSVDVRSHGIVIDGNWFLSYSRCLGEMYLYRIAFRICLLLSCHFCDALVALLSTAWKVLRFLRNEITSFKPYERTSTRIWLLILMSIMKQNSLAKKTNYSSRMLPCVWSFNVVCCIHCCTTIVGWQTKPKKNGTLALERVFLSD